MGNDHEDTAEMPAMADPASKPAAALPSSSWSTSRASRIRARSGATTKTTSSSPASSGRCDTLVTNLPEGEIPAALQGDRLRHARGRRRGRGGRRRDRQPTAIHALVDLVIETPDWIMRLDEPLADEVLQRMERRFQKIREMLVERAKAEPSLRGMATTMTVACTLGSELLTAHVGDSRAYLFRDGQLGASRATRPWHSRWSMPERSAPKRPRSTPRDTS